MIKLIAGQLRNLNKCPGQTAIEFVLGVVVLFIFFAGALKAFVWVNQTMIERQENYEATRAAAGTNWIMQSVIPDPNNGEDDYDMSTMPVLGKVAQLAGKNAIVNDFYNSHSSTDGVVGVLTGFLPTGTTLHSYEPLNIFNETTPKSNKPK